MANFRGVNITCDRLLNLPNVRLVKFIFDCESNLDKPYTFEIECSVVPNKELKTSVKNQIKARGFSSAEIKFHFDPPLRKTRNPLL